jgi:thiol-disulfide isomerase/thioredoxin
LVLANALWAEEGTAPAAGQATTQRTFRGVALTDLAGKKVALDSLLAKGPVVVNFWATWCGPCRVEMPLLEKVYQDLRLKGVAFAAISLDRRVSRETMEAFLKTRGFTVPVYRDEDAAVARRFSIASIPTTIVLKPSGEIFYLARGYRPGDDVLLRKKIEELVAAAANETGAGPSKQ